MRTAATLVRQVLINLVLNAVQAAGEQGRVSARVTLTAGVLHLEVGNSGSRIPPALMEHLFEPFTGSKETGRAGPLDHLSDRPAVARTHRRGQPGRLDPLRGRIARGKPAVTARESA